MNTRPRLVILLVLAAVGLFVGIWAAFFPQSFYDSFPGGTLAWVSVDGPFNEHLIRDVGSLYLGLGVASIVSAVLRDRRTPVVIGAAWTVFGVLHLIYHLQHLHVLPNAIDVIGNIVSLGGSLVLAVILLLPYRDRARSSA